MKTSLRWLLLVWLGGCASDPAWDQRVGTVEATLARAEELGAMRCAPRELALGRAHLGFAAFELERGHRSRAEEHLAIAEPNASAAVYLSPAERCSDQGAIVAPVDLSEPRSPDPVSDRVDLSEVTPPADPVPEPAVEPPGDDPEPPEAAVAPDRDADGVPDTTDECPLAAGEAGAACPGSYDGLVVRSERILLLRPLELDAEEAPTEATRLLLRALARALRDRPGMRIEIGAHTDSDGTELENLATTQRRAERLRDVLIAEGADPARVRARGYGEELPLESNSTEEGRAANRRVEIRRVEAGDGSL
mgnify:FL=1